MKLIVNLIRWIKKLLGASKETGKQDRSPGLTQTRGPIEVRGAVVGRDLIIDGHDSQAASVAKSEGEQGSGDMPRAGKGGNDGNDGHDDENEDLGLPEELHLGEAETTDLVRMVIQPAAKYVLCPHRSASHAAGCAVAKIAADYMAQRIWELSDQFNTAGKEMSIETKAEKLGPHLQNVMELEGVLRELVERCVGTEVGGEYLVMKTFGHLERGKSILAGQVAQIRERLDKRIRRMIELKSWLAAASLPRDWRSMLRDRLKESGNEIDDLGKQLRDEVWKRISLLAAEIRADWDRDIEKIWRSNCATRRIG